MPARTRPRRTDRILERLTALHPKLIDLSLDRMRGLLARLGHPEQHLPPAIHVAGTNGKGSLIACLRAMLEAAGFRVHVYTSPHLVRFNERIRLAGALVDDAGLEALLERVERLNAGAPITFFEVTTAAAFLAFAETPADVLLLETGLGGRLDATNVVARPALTAITPVAIDHTEFLGGTLGEIAAEKAGILKPGVGVVLAPQPAAADAAIRARAAAVGAPVFACGHDWQVCATADGLAWRSAATRLDLPRPGLAGAHQIVNAGTAVACLQLLPGLAVDRAAMAAGLAAVEWPARLQRLRRGPLQALLPTGAELWLDGGHNPAAAEVLAVELGGWRAALSPPPRCALVVAMKSNKDLDGFLGPLSAVADQVCGVPIPGDPQCHDGEAIAAAARRLGLPGMAAAGVPDALRAVAAETVADGRPLKVLIAGSLYLAGSVLAENG